jgi:hypothetical protein
MHFGKNTYHFVSRHIVRRFVRDAALEQDLLQSLLGLKKLSWQQLSAQKLLRYISDREPVPHIFPVVSVSVFKRICQPVVVLPEAVDKQAKGLGAASGQDVEELGSPVAFGLLQSAPKRKL